jgi:hypothetical protein
VASIEGAMGEHNRLSKGFVNWQGERVFLPWFGALRIAPSAEDEIRIVKLRYRAHVAMPFAFVPIVALLGLGWRLLSPMTGPRSFGDISVLVVMLTIVAVFGCCWLIERKRSDGWPIASVDRPQFLVRYYRSHSRAERLSALAWHGVGAMICFSACVTYVFGLSPIGILCAILGPMPLGLVTGEHTLAVLRSYVGSGETLPMDAGRL